MDLQDKKTDDSRSKSPRDTANQWLLTLRSPQSQHFLDVGFTGLLTKEGSPVFIIYSTIKKFCSFFLKYVSLKLWDLVLLVRNIFKYSGIFAQFSKRWLVKKLIWSRGRLGKPIASLIVFSVALVVFTVGEVLNSSKLVNRQEINPDYLTTVTDIIPQRYVAQTTIPESRKQATSFTYVVEGGDTLSGIGSKFRISVDAIKYVNGLTGDSIKPGDSLTIPPISGLIHEVKKGESLEDIADKYSVPAQAIADFNYILDTSKLAVGTELVIPDAKVPRPPVVVASPAFSVPGIITGGAPTPSDTYCVWPSTVYIVTQYFSWYHNGLDIATPWGQVPPLFACTSGTVVRSGWDPYGLGLHVIIDHGGGYQTVYGHMQQINVSYGQGVGRGEVIGLMGNTGRSTGPHVHFIVKYNGVAQNPLNYMRY